MPMNSNNGAAPPTPCHRRWRYLCPRLLKDFLPSTTYQPLQLLGIPRSLHCDPGSRAVDLTKIFRSKFDRRGVNVLFQPRELRRTGIGTIHDSWASSHASAI